jgi:hypothetical protein
LTQLIDWHSVTIEVIQRSRPISALLLPIFVIGQLICFCAPMQAAAHVEKEHVGKEADHACCRNESGDADHHKKPADKNQHDCDHCRGAQALIAQKAAADQSQGLKMLAAIWSPLTQTTAIPTAGTELPSISESFTLERPPPDLCVWHCALLN